MTKAVTGAELAGWLKLPAGQTASELAILDTVAASVTAFVEDVATDAKRTTEGDWTESTRLGAFMLGARLFRRRNSPNGVEAFTEQGAAYVTRFDSDVSRLLRLDLPRVG